VGGAHPAEDAGQHGEHQHSGQHAEERADGARGASVLPRDGRADAGHLVVRQGHRRRRRHHRCRWHHGRHCSHMHRDDTAVGGVCDFSCT
jgi:hypothetical protein